MSSRKIEHANPDKRRTRIIPVSWDFEKNIYQNTKDYFTKEKYTSISYGCVLQCFIMHQRKTSFK